MKKTVHILSLLIITAFSAAGQNLVTGTVSDSTGQPVAGASVTYSRVNSELISGYSVSDANGRFRLSISLSEDSISLGIRHIDYEPGNMVIKNEPGNHTIRLYKKIHTLPNIIVSPPPIYKWNDTLHYNVSAFQSNQDMVIGDIIKKLPGMEMVGDRILYQGKPIQKYYINGLDLLEGRYNLANDNLPVDAVQSVQVLENNQPVKILDSLIFSDRASLNIRLKKITTTGSAKIGAGLSPLLRDINITPMTFTKSFQSINTFQSNNIGEDVARQLNTFATGNMFDQSDFAGLNDNSHAAFVHIQDIASPNFNEKKWLNNNINLLSSNFLYKLQNNLELKGSVSYVNDYRQKAGLSHTTLFTAGQDIDFTENIQNSYNRNELTGNLILLKNEKNIYFKNNLRFSGRWFGDKGHLEKTDAGEILQQKKLQDRYLSNRLTLTTFLKRQLIIFNSYIGYNETPQGLSVMPGPFEPLLNNNLPYERVYQSISFTNFNTDNYLSFVKGFKGISLMPKAGISYQQQVLNSAVDITANGVERKLGNDFINQLRLTTLIAYLDVKAQYKTPKWKIDMDIPVRLRNYHSRDQIRGIRHALTRPTFEPGLLTIYQLNKNFETSFSSAYTYQTGNINTLYNAFLLSSYRNLEKYNASLPESNTWSNALRINFKDPLRSVFAGISYSYAMTSRNYLFRSALDANGYTIVEMDWQNNTQQMQSVSADYSKYFIPIKTIIKTKGNINWAQSDYRINNLQEKVSTRGYTASLEINNSSVRFLNIQYETNLSVIYNNLSGKAMDKIVMNFHKLNTGITFAKNQTIIVNTNYYITSLKSEANQLFIDILYRSTLPKQKMYLEINFMNLLNNQTFVRLYNLEYAIIRNNFQLRPRQVIFTVRFRF